MGCFSFICTECGKPINSTSFRGENVRLSLLDNGKVVEEMQGEYDSYGRVFNPEQDEHKHVNSFEWEYKEWGDIVDMMFDGNPKSGIAAAHVNCIAAGYVPTRQSKDDPNQGWGKVKREHQGKCEIYHKLL